MSYTFTPRRDVSGPGSPGSDVELGDGPLEVRLDELPDRLVTDEDRYDVYRYADWLPTAGERLHLGEGWTPLVEAPALAAETEAGVGAGPGTGTGGRDEGGGTDTGPAVFVKNETTNPTWSWKDRMAALVVPHAVAGGADRVATSTTGNHGSAVAAYAARAGIERILVFVDPSSEPPHHAGMRAYGAETVELTDESEAGRLLAELADRGWFVAYGLDGYDTGQPFVYEAYKTIAFEIVEQRGVPDAVVAAVGAGDGLYGVWKGFRELAEAGVVDEVPAMVSAEPTERHPLARAYEVGADEVDEDSGPEPLSTSTKSPTTGDHALAAVRDSGGEPTVVGRDALERATRAAGRAGVFLEPASALAAAGATQLAAREEYGTVVAVGSGAGVAWPEKTTELLGTYSTVEPTLSALEEAVPFDL